MTTDDNMIVGQNTDAADNFPLLKPVKQIKFAPLTGEQIADFFSLTPETKTFQAFIKEEMEFDKKWRNHKVC